MRVKSSQRLVRERLGALQEERVPVVRGVEETAAITTVRGDGGIGRRLPAPRDQLHRRAVCSHLHRLGGGRRARRHDRRRHRAGRRVARDRGAAVAARVFEHIGDALLP